MHSFYQSRLFSLEIGIIRQLRPCCLCVIVLDLLDVLLVHSEQTWLKSSGLDQVKIRITNKVINKHKILLTQVIFSITR